MKLLILGDGAALTTGFAQVIQRCAAEFVRRGWDVHQIAALDGPPLFDELAYRRQGITAWAPEKINDVGFDVLPRLKAAGQTFDAIFLNCDPGMGFNWLSLLDTHYADVPTIGYFPIEGAPICSAYADTFRRVQYPITYTAWSSDQLKRYYDLDIPWVYHGVDTTFWKPLTEAKKREVRRKLGWEGKFVSVYVARNAARKGHDRLIKAQRLLINGSTDIAGRDDYVLYLHCKPFEEHALYGWDLTFFTHVNGMDQYVQFPELATGTHGEQKVTLAERVAAADLYVHAAKIEGFGLPLIEAMACGLPLIIPADNGNMEEVVGSAPFARIKPTDWDTWFNGVQLCCVDPANFAEAIRTARFDRRGREAAAQRSLLRAQQFSWDTMATFIADGVAYVTASPLSPLPDTSYLDRTQQLTVIQ